MKGPSAISISLAVFVLLLPAKLSSGEAAKSPALSFDPMGLSSALMVRASSRFKAPIKLLTSARAQAYASKIPPEILFALIYTESSWRTRAKSLNKNGSADYGLMQLNSSNEEYFTWKFNDFQPYNAFNVLENLRIGSSYLAHLYGVYERWDIALAAYNCGPTKVAENRIPLSTRKYVAKILGLSSELAGHSRRGGNARD